MKKNPIILFFILLMCILSISIGYSAFGTNLNISGISTQVIPLRDIRITKFVKSNNANNGTVNYNNFTKDTLNFGINLPQPNSKIVFNVDITNYGNIEMGIFNIVGLPDYLEYKILGYNINDPICNSNNKCTNYATRSIKLEIMNKDKINLPLIKKSDISLKISFNPFYKVTYNNMNANGYKNKVMKNTNYVMMFDKDIPPKVKVKMGEKELIENVDYIYDKNILTINNVTGDLLITKTENVNIPTTKDLTVIFHNNGGGFIPNKYTYEFTLENKTQNDAIGWEIYLKVPKGTKIDHFNSCIATIDGEYLIVKNANWNGTIGAGKNLAYGFSITFVTPENTKFVEEYYSKIITKDQIQN